MEIFPAIDLQDGRCVRLTQGDFSTATVYDDDPPAQARRFAEAGAEWLHVVDLDGARDGGRRQTDIVASIAKNVPIKLQVGGGIRDAADIKKLLACGVERVVVGSLAAKNPALVKEWFAHFGAARIVLAFDVQIGEGVPEVMVDGWQSGSKQSLWDLLETYAASGLETVLCTDVGRDGMLAGTNHGLYADLRRRWPKLEILASGGASGLADLLQLAKLGVAGTVVGKAIYEGRLDLASAVRQVKHAG